jgi:hypothetical protein
MLGVQILRHVGVYERFRQAAGKVGLREKGLRLKRLFLTTPRDLYKTCFKRQANPRYVSIVKNYGAREGSELRKLDLSVCARCLFTPSPLSTCLTLTIIRLTMSTTLVHMLYQVDEIRIC